MYNNITEQEIMQSIEDNITEKIKENEETINNINNNIEKDIKFFEKQNLIAADKECKEKTRQLSFLRSQLNYLYFDEINPLQTYEEDLIKKQEEQIKEINNTLEQLGLYQLEIKDNQGNIKYQTTYQEAIQELIKMNQTNKKSGRGR
jgi:hypothetical protein